MSAYDSYRRNPPMGTPADPAPPGGLVERQACMHHARFGWWPAEFIGHVKRAYGCLVPARFLALSARLRDEKPWVLPERASGYMTITLLRPDGSIRSIDCFGRDDT